MSSIEFVDLATARASRGVRIVVSGFVPSPWSEAVKGLFRVQDVPVLAVRASRDAELASWTHAQNVPSVFHDDEPPRTVWSQILALAVRLGAPGGLLPVDLEQRAATVGMIHEIAGEDGLGWNQRLLMLDASFTTDGARGFALPIAQYLAPKYGYAADRIAGARARIVDVLLALRKKLGSSEYFDGTRPGALDIYCATFLTPLTIITDTDCPALSPALRQAFATAAEALGPDVPAELLAHRKRMFESHLAWPIQL
ncbi:MAG: hypothetical protein JWO36_2556 [Myxococcales bacterium]|nr:hypothetical protein [Myxococcales bacterium]